MLKNSIENVTKMTTASGKSIWWLISAEDGAPNFELRYLELRKNEKTSGESHIWEHEVYVLSGQGIAKDGDKETRIARDSVVFVPSDEHHCFVNNGDEILRFICVIPYL